MIERPLLLVVALSVLVVVVILAVGIGGFARGGDWNRRNGNRMMRWRLIAQAVAIIIILLVISLRSP